MADLITNLNTILQTKLEIKDILGIDSDVFSDYPTYISYALNNVGNIYSYSYITQNGDYDVHSYKNVNVDVPIPDGYTYTFGTLNITQNGLYDISSYAYVYINI